MNTPKIHILRHWLQNRKKGQGLCGKVVLAERLVEDPDVATCEGCRRAHNSAEPTSVAERSASFQTHTLFKIELSVYDAEGHKVIVADSDDAVLWQHVLQTIYQRELEAKTARKSEGS